MVLEAFKTLVEEEQHAIEFKMVTIDANVYPISIPVEVETPTVHIKDQKAFELWKSTNIIPQKQQGYVAIGIKVLLGDFYTDKGGTISRFGRKLCRWGDSIILTSKHLNSFCTRGFDSVLLSWS